MEAIRGMFTSGGGGGGGGPSYATELHDDDQDEYGPKQVDKKVRGFRAQAGRQEGAGVLGPKLVYGKVRGV